MTDNEIIKALENEIHLANDISGVHSMMIQIVLIKDALDLINRKNAEIKRLKVTIEDDRARHNSKLSDRRYACGVLWDSLEKETEENRKLQAELDQLAKENSDLIIEKDLLFDVAERRQNEIEELNIKLNAIRCPKYKYKAEIKTFVPESAENAIQTIKIDVIKDFAEKLKKRCDFFDKQGRPSACTLYVIDNLVEEMTERGGTE